MLGKFDKEDRLLVDEAIIASSEAVISIINDGIEIAMTQFNRFNGA